jgi:hypothetical protein
MLHVKTKMSTHMLKHIKAALVVEIAGCSCVVFGASSLSSRKVEELEWSRGALSESSSAALVIAGCCAAIWMVHSKMGGKEGQGAFWRLDIRGGVDDDQWQESRHPMVPAKIA